MNDIEHYFKPIVLVTGFGPFANHPVNASWEAVKLLDKEEIERVHNIELVLLEIPVTYENVDEFTPALWETHTPKLTIHVGVSDAAKCVTLESRAHKKGYQRPDYFNRCPAQHACPAAGAARLSTALDVARLAQDLAADGVPAAVSHDAGRYLCEYIYYHSLSADRARSLFVHVPPLAAAAAGDTARALRRVLAAALRQLDEATDAADAAAPATRD